MRLIDIINGPWAITPEMLMEIESIYTTHLRGDKIDIKAVSARIGAPLERKAQGYSIINSTAIIAVDGVIAKKMNLFSEISGGASTQLIARDFSAAKADKEVKNILLHIDSPGGTVDGTEELANLIYESRGDKRIIAYSDGMIASAAYWIAAAADEIYVSGDTAQVGSIGVVATHIDVSKAEEKIGRKTTEITAGKYKRLASRYEPLTQAGREDIQDRVDYLYSIFVNEVAKFRGVSPEKVLEDMADGRIFFGRQSVQAGLINGIEGFDALIEELAGDAKSSGVSFFENKKNVALAGDVNANEGEEIMTEKELKEKFPAVHAAIFEQGQTAGVEAGIAEGRKLGITEGSEAERARIKAVQDAHLPGHEKLIASLMFDGKTTAGEAALKVMAAEKAVLAGRAENYIADGQGIDVPVAGIGDDAAGVTPPVDNLPIEEKTKKKWDSDPELRSNYGGSYGAYLAYVKAVENGQVKIMGVKDLSKTI